VVAQIQIESSKKSGGQKRGFDRAKLTSDQALDEGPQTPLQSV
jgi:hypothetical protein